MKKIIIILIGYLSLISINSYSQNWLPVNSLFKYNYSPNGNGYDSTVTIHVDSVGVSGNDSIYYLNRILVPYGSYSVIINMPQFLQRTMIKSNNGDIIFKDTSSFLIKPFSSVGDNWMFDSVNNITAQLVSIDYIPVLGNNDSVKNIILSSSDTIILSQNYGLLQFSTSYLNTNKYKLVGVEGLNAGLSVPSFFDIYNFNPGDIFEYVDTFYHFNFNHSASTYTIVSEIKYTIQSKTISGDTVNYGISALRKEDNYYYLQTNQTIYSNYNTTLQFINSNQPYLNYFNNEKESYGGGYYQKMYLYNDLVFLAKGKGFSGLYNQSWNNDTLTGNISYFVKSEQYALNRGLIKYYNYINYMVDQQDFSQTIDSVLVGCKINGIVYGTLSPDSFFSRINDLSLNTNYLIVFPNPASSEITIRQTNSQLPLLSQIFITDILGNEVYSQAINNSNQITIDISKWSHGVYFYQIRNDKETLRGKFVVEK